MLAGAQIKNKEVLNVNSGGQHTLFLVSEEAVKEAEPKSSPAKIDQQPQQQQSTGNGTTEVIGNGKTTTSKPIKKAAAKKK